MMKLHQLQGYIQTILLAEYPDRLLLLDGCCRADVTFIKNYITKTLNRPLNHLKLIVVTHMHPDHAGGARKLRELTGSYIACANVSGEWYSGFDGKLMHITDILLTRWVASKMKKKQRWLWYPTKLNADIKLNDGEILPNFSDWQALSSQGHTDRDLSLHHLPSNRVYVADLIVSTRKGYIPPFPIFYPQRYRNSLAKIAAINADSIILAHGGEVTLTHQHFEEILTKAPDKPATHWQAIKAKFKKIFS